MNITHLIGPKPVTLSPVFVTPFVVNGIYVKDANGLSVLRVDSSNGSVNQDKGLAEEIVRLLNKEYGGAGVNKLVDGGGDDWFELEPNAWSMGGQSTGSGSLRTTERQSLDIARTRSDRYTRDKIDSDFGIKSNSETRVRL
jgi:hypothetical protein